MANTDRPYDYALQEPMWRECDECDTRYFIGAVMNPRIRMWRPIPLSFAPESVRGNFKIDWDQEAVELEDADDRSIGVHPIVVYGRGVFVPHNPSHFLDDIHVDETKSRWEPKRRPRNFRMRMDD